MTPPTLPSTRAALEDLSGLSWQPWQRDELADIAACYQASQSFDGNPERTSHTDLEEYWDAKRSVPAEDTLVARNDDGQVVAVARAGCNRAVTEKRTVYLGGTVHPDYRGRGIGRAILAWQLAHGRDWDARTREPGFGPLVMRLYAPADQDDVRELVEHQGLAIERYFFEMSRPLPSPADSPIVVPTLTGVRLEQWDPARSDEVCAVLNEAFRDHWGHVDQTPEMWQESITSHAFRPAWTFLAIDEHGEQVVGAVIGTAWEQDWAAQGYTEGYADLMGVLRSHRGRGVASALLMRSMAAYQEDGIQAAGLGVDTANPSGALRLYESLGYRPTASTCVYQVEEHG